MSGSLGGLGWGDLAAMFGHFMLLSLLTVGGAIAVAPEMSRYLVHEHGWLSDAQFTSSVALAQAAPGPNVLFVAVLGWDVAGPFGVLVSMVGILLPTSLLALWVWRWRSSRVDAPLVRAFTHGLAPLTVGLLFATSWILVEPFLGTVTSLHWPALALLLGGAGIMVRWKLNPLWLVAAGGAAGALGWV